MWSGVAQYLFENFGNPAFPLVCVGFFAFMLFSVIALRRLWAHWGEYLKWL